MPRHFTAAAAVTWVALALLLPPGADARQAPAVRRRRPASHFRVFIRRARSGPRAGPAVPHRVGLDHHLDAAGSARPPNFTNNRFEITYAPDWQPIELQLRRAHPGSHRSTLATSFGTTTAINEITQNGDHQQQERSDHRPHRRAAEQLLRGLRGAGRAPRAERAGGGDPGLRRAAGGDPDHGEGDHARRPIRRRPAS